MQFYVNRLLVLLCMEMLFVAAIAQNDTYILNGNSIQNSCNCYTLTQAQNWQGGSVWNAKKIDLNNPFDFRFNVFLGCSDAGADGIVFMLQPLSTSIGIQGEGMGFEGVKPSIGISLDTYQNINRNDPAFDHISIQANGNINHGADLAGPVAISATNNNVEDCQWHVLRISWQPTTRLMQVFFDGIKRLEITENIISNIFNNDPMVYWGFAAATGGANNLQQFCTALNPAYTSGIPGNEICPGQSIQLTDASESFAPIEKYYWDFGDGTTSTSKTPPPHAYSAPGLYEVKLALTAKDGCQSDTLKSIIKVGSIPRAEFSINDTCFNEMPVVTQPAEDKSLAYTWMLNGNTFSQDHNPSFQGLSQGNYKLKQQVSSRYGCGTASIYESDFSIYPLPQASIEAADGCVDKPVLFIGNTPNAADIQQWSWSVNNNPVSGTVQMQQVFTNTGTQRIQLQVTDKQGCRSAKAVKDIVITEAFADAGKDFTVIKNTGFQLAGNGNGSYLWSPATGLSDPTISNPGAMLQSDQQYTLTVTHPAGCIATDDVYVKVIDEPAIYVPTAFTPNRDGLNDLFRPVYLGINAVEFFKIYDRWGNEIFTSKDPARGWDGLYKGRMAATGTYIWLIRATDITGKLIEKKGSVTLIR